MAKFFSRKVKVFVTSVDTLHSKNDFSFELFNQKYSVLVTPQNYTFVGAFYNSADSDGVFQIMYISYFL